VALGAKGAARLQRHMTEHILATAAKVSDRPGLTTEVRHEGGNTDLMQEWLGSQFSYRPQGPGDLGRRMARAFEEAFRDSKLILFSRLLKGCKKTIWCSARRATAGIT
jgi:glycosyltransferase A (GT-A) superfamily protein (DUF2064 family)